MPIRPINPLTPAFRHAQTPVLPADGPKGPMYYEWWYFEVEFLDLQGRPFRIITSFHYPHALDAHRVTAHANFRRHSRFGDDPRHYAGLATYLVDMDRCQNVALFISRFRRNEIAGKLSVSRNGPVDLRFGASSFREVGPGKYRLIVEQSGLDLRRRPLHIAMSATFEQNSPGFEPPGGVLLASAGSPPKIHHWACVMPNPVVRIEGVTVTREVGGSKSSLCKADEHVGTLGGYHDHQWGNDLFWHQIARWSWGRVPLSRTSAGPKVVFFDVVPAGGVARPDPLLVHVPVTAAMPQAMTPVDRRAPFLVSQTWDRIDIHDGCMAALKGRGISYPRTEMIHAYDSNGVIRPIDIHHRMSNNVDIWPFYLRFTPPVNVGGKTIPAISEFMRADRLGDPPTLRALAASHRITTWAT